MERLKSITIIFLLAVGLLSSVAPAKTVSVLLQEGLYAEEIEGDLDAAIKIYEQVISESKEAQRAAAQATYRIGMCFLKKGEKAKAAEQYQNLISKYPEQQTLGARAREQLEKLGPDFTGGIDSAEHVWMAELIKSGKTPIFQTTIYVNSALDLDTGKSTPLKEQWPAYYDVAWEIVGRAALIKKPRSSVRFLALGEAENWEDAISMAQNSLAELRKSTATGMLGAQSKSGFAAVLTSEGNLAVVRVLGYNIKHADIGWWLEKLPAPSFGPVIEQVINYDGEEKHCLIDFDTGRLFSRSNEIRSEEAMLTWIAENQIDAMGETKTSGPGLYGFDMAVIAIAPETWERFSPKKLADDLSITKGGNPALMSAVRKLPVTCIFKTREGGMGVVQILEMQDNKKPRHFRIRYKMLQEKLPDIETLIKEMHEPEAQRFAALNKLIKIGAPAVEPLISELQKSNDWQVPKALGGIGDKRAVEPLIKKWQKCDWSPMKEVIAEALERITGKKLGQDKQKWEKWWLETCQFISPEATIKSFMAAAMKLDMNSAMVCVAGDSHDYKDIKAIFEKPEHPFNSLFRKIDPAVALKILETKIIDNMCEAVWQITFKEDFTIEGKTFKAGETFDIDGNLRRYGDKWLITGI